MVLRAFHFFDLVRRLQLSCLRKSVCRSEDLVLCSFFLPVALTLPGLLFQPGIITCTGSQDSLGLRPDFHTVSFSDTLTVAVSAFRVPQCYFAVFLQSLTAF